jgi:hypothetical protein
MSVLEKVSALLATPEPPELGPGPRTGIWEESRLARSLDEFFRDANLLDQNQQLIRALILLWHDHLDASHSISQNIANADGAFVHGIMHRREPDCGNAAYWFRRVGRHAAFGEIASRVRALLVKEGQAQLEKELISSGEWNAFAFIDACERCGARGVSDNEKKLLREIQQVETRVLLERFCQL